MYQKTHAANFPMMPMMATHSRYKTQERLSLRSKLLLAFGLLLTALLSAGMASWWTLDRVGDHSHRMATHYVPQIERISDAQVLMFRISLEARHLMLVDTDAERNETLGRIVAFREQKLGLLSEFEKGITTDQGREIFARIQAADVVFWRLAQEVAGKAMAGDSAGAFAQLESELVDARNAVLKPIGDQRAWQQNLLDKSIADTNRVTTIAKTALGIACALVLSFSAWLIFSLLRMMNGAFARAQRVTQQIADGKLDEGVYVRPGDEFGRLFDSIVNMQQRLHDVVSRVQQTSVQVISAAAELDKANHDLSDVSERQNQSIDDTAHHTQSMVVAIDESAQSAQHVNKLATKAAEIASQGGQAVGSVVAEMQGIGDASKRIGEIVSVIDGIAFQTNILALNAAVEAARAGEQGRGFAVVAGEVRSLAQRSAQAAKEVKALIDASNQRVQTGSQAAQNAGETMQRVVDSVSELSNLMASIAQATAQQRASAQKLGGSVQGLSQIASTSAAAVQRSQATASALREHARALDEAMDVFERQMA